jgi:MFS family permease
MDLSLTAPIWVLYLRDARGFSLAQITVLEVPLFLLIVFAEVPTGAVADRFGRRLSLALASAVLALSTFVYGVASRYPVILVANLTWGLAFSLRSGADVALLYDSLKQLGREGEFQRISGRFHAVRAAAMLAGFLLGAPIAAATSYSAAIVLGAAISGCALPLALCMREPGHAPAHAGVVADAFRLRGAFLLYAVVGVGLGGVALGLWIRAERAEGGRMRGRSATG